MKLAIIVLLGAAFLFVLGFQNVWLFFVGYVWTSMLYPSGFLQGYLDYIPLTFIFGLFSLIAYIGIDKSKRPSLPLSFYLALVFCIWVTFTSSQAVLQDTAWEKWRWASLSILIAVAAPLYLRTRVQIETGLIAILSALSAHVMTAGSKTILGTGGYDRLGRLIMDNSWLGETSTLALAAVITVPLAWYVARHSIIFGGTSRKKRYLVFAAYSFMAVMCVIGTSARTGLLALAALVLVGLRGMIPRILAICAMVGFAMFGQALLPSRSLHRFETLQTYQQDSSAETRVAAWRWALDYASNNPIGGGFTIFNQSVIHWSIADNRGHTTEFTQYGRAAHSVYFEVLGEQGFFGLALFVLILISSALGCLRLSRRKSTNPDDVWLPRLAYALFSCIAIFSVGGAFVGIAYQPLIYCFVGLYAGLCGLARQARVSAPRVPVLVPAQ